MRHLVLFLLPVIFLGCGCEDQQLIRVPCPPGDVRECSWDPESTLIPVSDCIGARGPEEEICDGLDNDCDLYIDETYPEEHQLCGFVEGADYGVGVCVPGVMTCDNGAPRCEGHIGPSGELCDGLDNNCNGTVDEGVANAEQEFGIVKKVVSMDRVTVRYFRFPKSVIIKIMTAMARLMKVLIIVV